MNERPKTYKESFEMVCKEYGRLKTYTTIKIYALSALVLFLLVVIFGLFVLMYS